LQLMGNIFIPVDIIYGYVNVMLCNETTTFLPNTEYLFILTFGCFPSSINTHFLLSACMPA
jgi:hypothetical protein